MRTRTWILVGVGAVIAMASEAGAQQRTTGSGIRVTKDGGAASVSTTSSATRTGVATGEVATTAVSATTFTLAPYANMNEKNMTAHMAAGDSLEIQISQLAQTKGMDQRVRDFAATLVNDHTAHLAKTWEIITDEDVGAAPLAFDPEGVRMRETLAQLRNLGGGTEWDATFLRFQATHHQNEIDLLTPVIKNAHDDDLEDHIDKTLQSLARHRDAARSIASQLGVTLP